MTPKRMKAVFLREYLPFTIRLASIAIVAVAVGHADTVRLIAAVIVGRAARALTSLDTSRLILLRRGSETTQRTADLRRAALLETICLGAELAVLGAFALALFLIGDGKSAILILAAAAGAPPEHFLFLARADRPRRVFRHVRPIAMIALVALVSITSPAHVLNFVLAFAASRWIAVFAAMFGGAKPVTRGKQITSPFRWTDAARRTGTLGKRRIGYLIGKQILSAFLGPVGGIAARTGRGFRIHERSVPMVDRVGIHRLAIVSCIAFAAAAAGHAIFVEPSTLILAAATARIAATAISTASWARYATDSVDTIEDEDEDD